MTAKKTKTDTEETDGIDWWEVERKYVHGSLPGKKLAEQLNVPYTTLHKRGTDGGWKDKRKNYQAALNEKLTADAVERRRKLAADMDDDVAEISRRAIQKAAKLIDEAPSCTQLKAGMDALNKAYRMGREAMGLPAEKEPVREMRADTRGQPHYLTMNTTAHGLIVIEQDSGAEFHQINAATNPPSPEMTAYGCFPFKVERPNPPEAGNADDEEMLPDPEKVQSGGDSGSSGEVQAPQQVVEQAAEQPAGGDPKPDYSTDRLPTAAAFS